MNYDQIGKFILEKRKAKKLTQKELAYKIGVTDKAISKWERGQGCPDISILEILSKELDCSILELLKGREIENEVIPVTEADDYIRESITFTKMNAKNKIKTILNRIIEMLVVFIVLILTYLNVVQIMYIDTEYTYTSNRDDRKKIEGYINTIEENMNIIQNNKGLFNDSDYQEILNNLNSYYDDINKIKILKYIRDRKNFTYTINDVRILNLKGYYLSYEMKVLDILNNYAVNDNIILYENLTTESFFYNGATSHSIDIKPYFTYQYRISSSKDMGEDLFGLDNGDLDYIVYDLRHEFTKLIYLTELVMEVGDINE